MIGFKEFLNRPRKIRAEVPKHLLPDNYESLDEAVRAKVGRYSARLDSPHFQGDEPHCHIKMPDGHEVSWNKSGTRRHPNKFPAKAPRDGKAAGAKALGVSPNILEGYRFFDETIVFVSNGE
ncbi:MAG: hypothetical protein NT166_29000 [Candidatus Aminicenantes bacterium]|nr:hypothetical protein [Candidatus Aminicenantes bacterium]